MPPPLPEHLLTPHPDRLDPDHPARNRIMAAHAAAVEAGRPGYLDPLTGLFVQTAVALWARGHCCDSGCRHCPWVVRPDAEPS